MSELPVPAIAIGPNGLVRDVNEAAAAVLETTRDELLGHPREQLPPVSRHTAEIPLANGSHLLIFGESDDVAELRRQLYHYSRLASVGRLVSTVVHELNNSLFGIMGYSQFLLQHTVPEPARRDVERIHEAAQRASQVMANLLRFTRDRGTDPVTLDLTEVVRRCLELKKRDLRLKSVTATLEAPEAPQLVTGNEALLFQVILNLITNAEQSIRSHADRGSIRLVVGHSLRKVRVDVFDDGPGVPDEARSKIFQPFFSTRSGDQGSGLGLTLCRQILREHRGDVRLMKPPRQGGAHFRIDLPHAAETAQPVAAPGSRPALHAVHDLDVVVVEDEATIRELISRAFLEQSNRVAAFETGEEALTHLEDHAADLVVSDVRRPGLGGVELFEEVRRRQPALAGRFLLVTGDTESSETNSFIRRHRIPVLRKPVTVAGLMERAYSLLEEQKATEEDLESEA